MIGHPSLGRPKYNGPLLSRETSQDRWDSVSIYYSTMFAYKNKDLIFEYNIILPKKKKLLKKKDSFIYFYFYFRTKFYKIFFDPYPMYIWGYDMNFWFNQCCFCHIFCYENRFLHYKVFGEKCNQKYNYYLKSRIINVSYNICTYKQNKNFLSSFYTNFQINFKKCITKEVCVLSIKRNFNQRSRDCNVTSKY